MRVDYKFLVYYAYFMLLCAFFFFFPNHKLIFTNQFRKVCWNCYTYIFYLRISFLFFFFSFLRSYEYIVNFAIKRGIRLCVSDIVETKSSLSLSLLVLSFTVEDRANCTISYMERKHCIRIVKQHGFSGVSWQWLPARRVNKLIDFLTQSHVDRKVSHCEITRAILFPFLPPQFAKYTYARLWGKFHTFFLKKI